MSFITEYIWKRFFSDWTYERFLIYIYEIKLYGKDVVDAFREEYEEVS